MAKSEKTTSKVLELSIPQTWGHMFEADAFLYYPGKDDWRKRLCFTMIKWASTASEEGKPLEIGQFCMRYHIPYDTLRDWTIKYPDDIGLYYKRMKWFIASHRKVGSMKRELAGEYAYRDMHVYDPEWSDVNEYWNNLKKDVAAAESKPAIVIDNLVTESGEVIYPKKDSDETKV